MENISYTEEETQRGRYLTFALAGESFGMEICYVTEIVGVQPITPIPDAPSYVKGIINLRGRIIPVIDMRLKFGKEPGAYSDRTCIIVVEIRRDSVGLIVDSVTEVLSIDEGNIVQPPAMGAGVEHIKAIGKVGADVKLLLDCEKLMQASLDV